MKSIQVYADRAAQTRAAVALFVSLAQQAVLERGLFTAALSGGSTPEPVYAALAAPDLQNQLDWEYIHLFFGDERHVPLEDPASNFRRVKEALLSKVDLPAENIHRVRTETDVRLAAFSYEEELRAYFDGPWPCFDLVLLGMGSDGHTASLFPETTGLHEEQRWFIANRTSAGVAWRLTLTKNAINHARMIAVLVNGQTKAEMLAEVMTGSFEPEQKPIQLISPVDGEMVWLVDQDAASKLPEELIS
jgi:6-phosphogluconolactonase